MSLKGKVALVTGGDGGIGAAIVLELARQGASVVINYHSHQEAARAIEQKANGLGASTLTVQGDVGQVAQVENMIKESVKRFGHLDILVNNAGLETRTSILDTSEEQYDRVLNLNLKGAFFAMQYAAKQMIRQNTGGRIINISSVHEDWPMPGNTPYCLSKGGMRMLTRTAALELAKHNILVVGVGPGAVATPINQATMKDPTLLTKLNQAIPLGYIAKPEQIATVVAFLAGEGASYMTATTLFVDGGLMHQSPGL